jgi:hypothetical protein
MKTNDIYVIYWLFGDEYNLEGSEIICYTENEEEASILCAAKNKELKWIKKKLWGKNRKFSEKEMELMHEHCYDFERYEYKRIQSYNKR